MKRTAITIMPEVAPGSEVGSPPSLGDKRSVATLAGMKTTRWVDDQLALGMPHLKLGPRRVRFDLVEVREWLKQKYSRSVHQVKKAAA
jgi:hypothetical protein